MRVFLRHSKTGLLFEEPDRWTADPAKARVFRHSAEAMDTARANKLREVDVLLAFEEPRREVRLPLPYAWSPQDAITPGTQVLRRPSSG